MDSLLRAEIGSFRTTEMRARTTPSFVDPKVYVPVLTQHLLPMCDAWVHPHKSQRGQNTP
eukprot:353273-Chlamydomonas_euryale.AAC.18